MGGTYQGALAANPPTLDPHATSSAFTFNVLGLAMSRLFAFKTGPDKSTFENYEVIPDLALSAESPDAINWTIKLRPGTNFHNIAPVNGHPVQAEDVRATFQRALAPKAVNQAPFDAIDPNQIQSPSGDTVTFKLKYPFAWLPELLAYSYALIVPREALAGSYDPAKTVIGSGPFTLESFTPDVGAVAKKNPNWYQKGQPYIDGVRLAIVPDPATQEAQFTAGNIDDIALPLGSQDIDTLKNRNPKALVRQTLGANGYYIASQLRDPASPFQDIRVRRAISVALDRDALGKTTIGQGYYLQPVFGRIWGKWVLHMEDLPASTQQWFKYDPTQAKQLLSAAGADKLTIKFDETKPQPVGQAFYGTAEGSYNFLSALPWKISLVTIDYNKDWVGGGKGVRYGNFGNDTLVLAGLEGAANLDEQMYDHFSGTSNKNVTGINDNKLNAMIDKARTIVNEDERVKAYKDIQAYMAEQLYGINGFAGGNGFELTQPSIKNSSIGGNLTGTDNLAKLWISR
jgi:peptide/nickel transport system substrate-binding protein